MVDLRAEDGEKNVVAVITTYVDDYIFPSTIRGIENTLSDKGYSMQLSFTNNTVGKERQILQDLLAVKGDGDIFEINDVCQLPFHPSMYSD